MPDRLLSLLRFIEDRREVFLSRRFSMALILEHPKNKIQLVRTPGSAFIVQ